MSFFKLNLFLKYNCQLFQTILDTVANVRMLTRQTKLNMVNYLLNISMLL